MKTVHRSSALALAALAWHGSGAAQEATPVDLIVSNARVVTGTGTVLERGAILVRDGRIVSIEEGNSAVAAELVVDAAGKTVLPGLIDTHRHLLAYSGATSEARLESFVEDELRGVLERLLANGLTTVMSPGDFEPEIFEIRRRLEEGELSGPRLVASGPVFTAPGGHPACGPVCACDPFCRARCAVEVGDPEAAQAAVERLVAQGTEAIKLVIDRTIVPGTVIDEAVLAAIADATVAQDVPLMVHATSVADATWAVDFGADRLVHSPEGGSVVEPAFATHLAERGVSVSTTVAYSTRASAAGMGIPWDETQFERHLGNVRALVDAGVVVAFGTDNPPWYDRADFLYEVEALATVLEPREVIASLTVQAARFLDLDDRLGTLEPGKVADLIVVDGDPLEDLAALGRVRMVVKEGRVVVDGR